MELREMEVIGTPHERHELISIFGQVMIWPDKNIATSLQLNRRSKDLFVLIPNENLFTVSPLEKGVGDMVHVDDIGNVIEFRIDGMRLRVHMTPLQVASC